MPRHHCKTCGNPLHADDTHAEYVSRLGKSHADAALSGADCSHCERFSLASLRSRSAFFFMVSAEEPSRCRLEVPLLSRSSYELTILWHAPTRLASVLLLQLLSHPLTALKKKDTSTCLLWMSLCLHIYEHP